MRPANATLPASASGKSATALHFTLNQHTTESGTKLKSARTML
jgi:hypothetical protein